MPVLLLRLAGPQQSWGTESRFTVRDTRREPSKSGVVGLLAAACGLRRDDAAALAPLANLSLGVRVDRPGRLERDYHTAGGGQRPGGRPYGVIKADGSRGDPVVSERHYLADAEFLVGLAGDDQALLRELDAALRRPAWPLYLGRRAFVPTPPLRLGVQDAELEAVLRGWRWWARSEREQVPSPGLRLLLETDDPQQEARYDQPVSFASDDRRYRLRYLRTAWLPAEQVHREVHPCIYPA